MARIAAVVGYGVTAEKADQPGVWVDTITERTLYGDLNKNQKQNDFSAGVNSNISITNELSLVADPYALQNFMNIKYVIFNSIKWTVKSVTVNYPRLIFSLGGIYNGQ